MSAATNIEWADSTFNPWEGCQKVGPGCDHCYAEARNARFGGGQASNWGPGAPRRRTSASNWGLPLRWDAKRFMQCDKCGWRGECAAELIGCGACGCIDQLRDVRRRVFCASLGDIFDNQVPFAWRVELFQLIGRTSNIDWLLLTKRIGLARQMLNEVVEELSHGLNTWDERPWPGVWIGATVVNQEEADRDLPKLMQTPASRRFLSMEPLLGLVDLGLDCPWVVSLDGRPLDWVIVGGESGPSARPMRAQWAQSLRDQCAAAGVPFLFKQWGEHLGEKQDGNFAHEPMELNATDDPVRVGKKAAGRLLDGRTHDGFPEAHHA